MKKMIALLFAGILSASLSRGCTTFFIHFKGQLIFGRNYDWVTGNGMVCTNLRGLNKTSYPVADGATISWVSRYGSISFNQYGKEFPTGGMNEKGLVVELMWLDGTRYPEADKRPAVGVLQWIQYQLDNSSSVDELIATDTQIRISASSGSSPLHYLVADAGGNAATIEFLEGKMVVHKGSELPYPVLTNDVYASSVIQAKQLVESSPANKIKAANNSIERFATACSLLTEMQQPGTSRPLIDQAFSLLEKVAQGTHTKWSIVYDLVNKKIHFKTLSYPAIKWVAFQAFDFRCSTNSKLFDMNQPGEGDKAGQFRDFSPGLNEKLIGQSFDESRSEFTVSEEKRKARSQYGAKKECSKE